MNDIFVPKNQADCDHANALREYDAAHKVWMNTSIFTDAGKEAKRVMEAAGNRLTAAIKVAHPTWIVF